MHCHSCVMNIDGVLEETEGIVSVSTSYAKSETKVGYDETKLDIAKIIQAIKISGYAAVVK